MQVVNDIPDGYVNVNDLEEYVTNEQFVVQFKGLPRVEEAHRLVDAGIILKTPVNGKFVAMTFSGKVIEDGYILSKVAKNLLEDDYQINVAPVTNVNLLPFTEADF